ncbi:hypothetical protein VTI74DRAFT_7534 [Chaetomium olivicolor]
MTHAVVYFAALVALLVATTLTLSALLSPTWVSLSVIPPSGGTVTDTIGLFRRCHTSSPSSPSSATGKCAPFPDAARCRDDGSFCSMWRTAGFLMSFAFVVELATVVGFFIIMAGGKVKRQGGWKVLGGLLSAVGVVEVGAMAVVAYIYDHDQMFLVPGYRLDSSWLICLGSAGIAMLTGAGLVVSAVLLPPEDGYQLLSEPSGV